MKTTTLTPVALACALLVSAVAPVQASVVAYGNLGSSGIGTLSDTNTDFGPGAATNKIVAQGFTTGSDAAFLKVTGVSVGLFAENPGGNRTVSIYTNTASGSPGALFATSGQTFVSVPNVYQFSFGAGVILSPSTSYWIVPQFNVDSSWHFASDFSSPVGQNSSGYTYLGTLTSNNNLSGAWSSTIGAPAVSLTVAPVPEPSSIALAGIGIVVAGLSYRRRMRRVTSTEANETT